MTRKSSENRKIGKESHTELDFTQHMWWTKKKLARDYDISNDFKMKRCKEKALFDSDFVGSRRLVGKMKGYKNEVKERKRICMMHIFR